jgi:uncharacterized RDD family membrane protein YckC
MTDPYQPPRVELDTDQLHYAGFWLRLLSLLIDTLILMPVIYALAYTIYGPAYFTSATILQGPADLVITYVLPVAATIGFWKWKSATPGKIILGLKIVDANGAQPSTGQYLSRYFAYLISMLPLFLGYFWVAWDRHKQAWHDKLARTYVIRVTK